MPLNRNGSTTPATYSASKVGGNSPTGSVSSDILTVPGFSDRADPATTCGCLAIWVSIDCRIGLLDRASHPCNVVTLNEPMCRPPRTDGGIDHRHSDSD